MRMLFVHEVNYEHKVIYEMHEFPELFALAGNEVSFFHFPEGPNGTTRSWRTRRERISGRAYPEASIELISPPTWGGSVIERYLAPIVNVPSLRREIRSGHYDVIVLYAVPTTGWQTVSLARRAGVPVVFRALDVSHMIRSSVLSPLIRAAERYIYPRVQLLSANNGGLAEYCVAESGRVGPVSINLPPLDLSHFAGGDGAGKRNALGIPEEARIIMYMGSFFDFSGLDIVLEELVPHLRADSTLRFVLVGGGDLDSRLRQRVTELRLDDRVVFTGVVKYDELPSYLAMADAAINPFVPQLVTNVALPHKVLQYLAAGRPTVSTDLRGLRSVLGEEAGVLWAADPRGVATRAVELVRKDEASLAAMAASGTAFVNSRFSAGASLSSFDESIRSVVGASRQS